VDGEFGGVWAMVVPPTNVNDAPIIRTFPIMQLPFHGRWIHGND
jgi:hypothetical protein